MPPDERYLTAAEMLEAASKHRLAITFDPSDVDDGPIAQGWYAEKKPQPKLAVMAGRMRPLRNLLHGMTASPMVYFGLTLEGTVYNQWSQKNFTWSNGDFLAASVREPVALQSLHPADETVAMAGVIIERDWLEAVAATYHGTDDQSVSAFLNSHLELKAGKATPAMLEIARRMMATMREEGLIGALHQEAAALDFVAVMFETITGTGETAERKLARIDRQRIARVRERLDAASSEERLSLYDIAEELGYSVSTLCRHFRQAYGISIGHYLADRRLQIARQALISGETIARAAYMAGYASPTSFSTAFKRTFGISPGQLQ
jgi:AraC-like DNA-binding protein